MARNFSPALITSEASFLHDGQYLEEEITETFQKHSQKQELGIHGQCKVFEKTYTLEATVYQFLNWRIALQLNCLKWCGTKPFCSRRMFCRYFEVIFKYEAFVNLFGLTSAQSLTLYWTDIKYKQNEINPQLILNIINPMNCILRCNKKTYTYVWFTLDPLTYTYVWFTLDPLTLLAILMYKIITSQR